MEGVQLPPLARSRQLIQLQQRGERREGGEERTAALALAHTLTHRTVTHCRCCASPFPRPMLSSPPAASPTSASSSSSRRSPSSASRRARHRWGLLRAFYTEPSDFNAHPHHPHHQQQRHPPPPTFTRLQPLVTHITAQQRRRAAAAAAAGQMKGAAGERGRGEATDEQSTSPHPRSMWHRLRVSFWPHVLPFLLLLLFFLWSFHFNCTLQVMAQRREDVQAALLHDPFDYYKRHHHHQKGVPAAPPPQPDLLYRVLPFFHFWIVNDILAITLLVLLFLKFAFLSSCSFVMVLKRYFLIQGLLFLSRGVSIYLTGMTVPLTVSSNESEREKGKEEERDADSA